MKFSSDNCSCGSNKLESGEQAIPQGFRPSHDGFLEGCETTPQENAMETVKQEDNTFLERLTSCDGIITARQPFQKL